MNRRLLYPLGSFAALMALAAVTLDGKIRLATLVFLAGFAVKTVIHLISRRRSHSSSTPTLEDPNMGL